MKNFASQNMLNSHKHNFEKNICSISKKLSKTEKPCEDEELKEPAWKCRHVVAITGFFVSFLSSIHRTVMGVAIVAMVNNTAVSQTSKVKSQSCLELITNSTEDAFPHRDRIKFYQGDFNWSPEMQGYILGIFFVGQVVALIPSGRMAERFGSKYILVGSFFATSIFTMLIPPFARLSVYAVIIIQLLRGLTQGMPDPSVTTLMTNWCPKNERGFLYSLMLTSYSLGPALGNMFVGYVSQSPAGWPYALYSIGGSGLVLALYMFFFIAENPREHPRISKAELNFILSNQESTLSRKRPKLPWSQIFTSIPVYAAFLARFARYWIYAQFVVVHSTFLGTILHYPIGENGLLSSIPFLVSFAVSLVASWISGYFEKKEIVSVNVLRKSWVIISGLLYSLCLLGMYFAGCNRNLSVIFSILSMSCFGLGTPGISLITQDMSPTFAGTLLSILNTFTFSAGILLPVTVGSLTDKRQTLEQWNKVFFITIGVVMFSTVAFTIFGSAKVQPWNFVGEESEKNDEKQSEKEEITRF